MEESPGLYAFEEWSIDTPIDDDSAPVYFS